MSRMQILAITCGCKRWCHEWMCKQRTDGAQTLMLKA